MPRKLSPIKETTNPKALTPIKQRKRPSKKVNEATSYTPDGAYIAGQRIMHPTLGLGRVNYVRYGKMLVLMDADRGSKQERQLLCAKVNHLQRVKANKDFRKLRPLSTNVHVCLVMEVEDREKALQRAHERSRRITGIDPKRESEVSMLAELEAVLLAS